MTTWIRKHVDPDELLTILVCAGWMWAGASTWADLIGKPRDAPHLRIPGEVRAVVWWVTAAAPLLTLRLSRTCALRRSALVGLLIMPTVRLTSYVFSWVASWELVDGFIPDRWIIGDSHAWGSLWIYMVLDVLVVCTILAPWSWVYLDRSPRRAARLEHKPKGEK